MPYLIDGHNVIHALPDLDLEDPYDEAKLIIKLRAWASRERRKMVVIFDGGIPGGTSRELSNSDVKVVFAARHYTIADRIIKERLGNLADPGNWVIISSDHEVLDHARRVGARTMTAQVFADRLSIPPDAEKEKPDTISQAEVEAWLKIFDQPAEVGASEDEAQDVSPSPPRTHAVQKASSPPRKKPTSRSPHAAKDSKRRTRKTTRTIGEQVGFKPTTPKREPRRRETGEKPTGVSAEEMETWLEMFPEPAEQPIRPYQSADQPSKQQQRKKPSFTIKKDAAEGLSDDEVQTWLKLFGAQAPSPPSSEPAPPSRPKTRRRKRRLSSKLRKQKQQMARPAEDKAENGLSEEDLELWYRAFGEEE